MPNYLPANHQMSVVHVSFTEEPGQKIVRRYPVIGWVIEPDKDGQLDTTPLTPGWARDYGEQDRDDFWLLQMPDGTFASFPGCVRTFRNLGEAVAWRREEIAHIKDEGLP